MMSLLRFLPLLMLCGFHPIWAGSAHAEAAPAQSVPLPRFMSLKRPVANVRMGPGTQYPIRWVYQKIGLPVEVIARFGNWRRIRGSDGSDGWVHNVLLSSNRTALASPWSRRNVDLRSRPTDRSGIVARLQSRVLVRLRRCDRTWCLVSVPGRNLRGFVRQDKLWGVYPDEVITSRSVWRSMGRLFGD